jgi:NAD(P)H-nitrite reductase large subunit
VDDAWRPLPDTAETLAVDTIAIGFGLIPSTELARSMGCACAFHPEQGGYVPRRDADMQTSLAGVYAVGDGAGIGGATIAQIEGRIAGVAAAHYLGKLPEAALKTAISREQVALRRHRRFTDMLAALFAPKPGIYALADDDTIICRCEEVTLGDIRRAVDAGARDVNTVKGLTRAGMGNCQGRICGELIAHIIAAETGQADDVHAIESAGCLSARPPLHPLPLEVIAQTAGSASDL